MKILAVDTTEQGGSIALVDNGIPLCDRYVAGLKKSCSDPHAPG